MSKAVIFDCDGVLVDSELVSCTAAVVALSENGVATDLAEIQTMIGKSNREVIEYYQQRDGISLDIDQVNRRIEENYFRLADGLQPMPGITLLLEKLSKQQVPLAVASSGGYRKIEFSLAKTGLKQFFSVICSAVDVAKGKPEPDLFLYAATKLLHQPQDCLVVEDSVYGIMAAKKAGMLAVGYPSSFTGRELRQAGADLVVNDFAEIWRQFFG